MRFPWLEGIPRLPQRTESADSPGRSRFRHDPGAGRRGTNRGAWRFPSSAVRTTSSSLFRGFSRRVVAFPIDGLAGPSSRNAPSRRRAQFPSTGFAYRLLLSDDRPRVAQQPSKVALDGFRSRRAARTLNGKRSNKMMPESRERLGIPIECASSAPAKCRQVHSCGLRKMPPSHWLPLDLAT